MSFDATMFDSPDFDVDPECDAQPHVPEGTYTNAEHQARIISLAPQSIDTKNGPVAFVAINVLIVDPEQGGVFARTGPFGAGHTQLAKNSGSMWPQFAAGLKLDASRQPGEGIGEHWARLAVEAENMPVTVTVGVDSYVRREDRLPQEELDAGRQPRRTIKNFIRNIVAE